VYCGGLLLLARVQFFVRYLFVLWLRVMWHRVKGSVVVQWPFARSDWHSMWVEGGGSAGGGSCCRSEQVQVGRESVELIFLCVARFFAQPRSDFFHAEAWENLANMVVRDQGAPLPALVTSSGVVSGVGHAFFHSFSTIGKNSFEVVLFTCAVLNPARCIFSQSS